MSEYKIVAERTVSRQLPDKTAREQVSRCAVLSLKGTRGKGFAHKVGRIETPRSNGSVTYRATVQYTVTSKRIKDPDVKWGQIVERFAQAGCAGNLKSHPWVVRSPEGYAAIADEKLTPEEPKTLGGINLEPGDHFTRIYSRDAQIRRIMDALALGHRTDWKHRKNCLLDGPPGCGKSEIMKAMARMLGREHEAYWWFDAPNMTKAGAIEQIMKAKVLPPVLFLEEIEKVEEAVLRFLLGLMDTRGEMRRVNYRVGNEAKNVHMLVIASANDVKLLRRVMSGALYSRFQNKIYCPEPDRHVMGLILGRECAEIGGDPAWIEPTLEFAYDKWAITDPRDVITIMSLGGNRLLSGDAQADYEATMHPLEKRFLLRKKKKREAA